MYQLQTSVVINNRQFNITNDGDFRMVLDCFKALNDETLSEDFRVLASLLIFYNEFTDVDEILFLEEDTVTALVKEMYKFFNCGQDEAPGVKTHHQLIDWDKDEQIVSSAINHVANTEIRSVPYIHWWTFLGYYMSVGESVLSTVVGIRNKIVTHKKLEKWEQEFKRSNPNYFHWNRSSLEDREAESLIRELWNKGGEK